MSKMLKPAILSLSLLTVICTSSLSPALADIAEFFSSSKIFLVQQVVVLHAFAIVPTLPVATWLADRFSKKRVVITGLLVFVFFGTVGGLVNNIYILLATRALLGVGLGMVIPFSTALIADFYDGEERQRLMGLSSSLNMVGGMSALITAGYLAVFSWRLPFLIHLFGIPVLLLILFYLPESAETEEDEKVSAATFPPHVYKVAFIMLLFSVLFFILTPTMALFLKNNSLGDSRVAGFAIAFTSGGGIISGFLLDRTLKLTGRYFIPAMLMGTSIGFLLLHFSPYIGIVFLGTFIIGFSNRSIYPIFFLKATQDVPRRYTVKATAIISATIYIGQFLAPNFQKLVGMIFHDPSARFLYLFVAAVTFISGMILFLRILFEGFVPQRNNDGRQQKW